MTGTLRTRKRKDGEYYYIQLSYKDPHTNKWRLKTLATGLIAKGNKRKAEAMIRTMIDKYSYLEELPAEYNTEIAPDISFCDYMDIWLKGKKRDIRTSTVEAYRYRVERFKLYFGPKNYKLIDITPKIIDVFFKYSLNNGKINQKTKKPEELSVRSVRDYRSLLYAMFNQAMIDGLVKINPVIGVSVHGKKNKEYAEEMLFMTEEEIAKLLQFLSLNYPQLVGIAFVGAYYGLRRSEILGLKWSAIDFEKKTININHTVVRVKTVEASDATKTHSSKRTLSLFGTAEKCFLNIRKDQAENKAFFKKEYKNNDGYIFTWEDGTLYDPNYITRLFSRATKEFGRPEITLHKLRHSCASMLINKGWDIKQLQYWLGHSDTSTTLNIYAHFNKHRLNAGINDLAEISLVSAQLFA